MANNTVGQGVAASIHNPASAQGTPHIPEINLNDPGPAPPYHAPPNLTPEQQHLLNQMHQIVAPMQQELAERDAMIQDLQNRMEQMQGRLNMQAHVAPAPPRSALTVQARPPEEFTGDRTKFEGWVSQLNLFF